MPAHPWEYHKPWQNCCDLKFYLAVMVLRTCILLITKKKKSNDLGIETELFLVDWIIFSKVPLASLL